MFCFFPELNCRQPWKTLWSRPAAPSDLAWEAISPQLWGESMQQHEGRFNEPSPAMPVRYWSRSRRTTNTETELKDRQTCFLTGLILRQIHFSLREIWLPMNQTSGRIATALQERNWDNADECCQILGWFINIWIYHYPIAFLAYLGPLCWLPRWGFPSPMEESQWDKLSHDQASTK